MNTPFFDAMAALAAQGPRFFVPGHKGNPAAIVPFGPLLAYDLTEIAGADDLSCPAGPLAKSEANMTRVFGSGATLYSASGSSSCIAAMLALFAGAGGGVVALRGCHVAAVRAMAMLDLQVQWVPLREDGRPGAAEMDAALAASGHKVVYMTGLDYRGRLADVAAMAEVCGRHGAALLVDNAQGAHLRFLRPERHPLALGADACADSAHKSLPCLTPAALLHLKSAALAPRARQMLNLFCSTSPSYLVLESLDLAAGLLLAGNVDFEATASRLKKAAGAFPALCAPCDDALRLCLRPAQAGLPYEAVATALKQAGMVPEYADGNDLVLMASPWNREDDFAKLERVLEQLSQCERRTCLNKVPINDIFLSGELPAAAIPTRQALFAEHERLPTAQASGRVMGGLHAPCPPGVPLVLPGEVLDEKGLDALARGGIFSVDVLK